LHRKKIPAKHLPIKNNAIKKENQNAHDLNPKKCAKVKMQ
jgi:hypothetical protein